VRAALLLAVVAAVGCRHTLRAADPRRPVELPRDHAAHGDAQTEWWHLHGHLVDDRGRRYDWFLAFIRQHTDHDSILHLPMHWFVDPFQVAYFAVTDRAAGSFRVREKHAWPDVWAASADGHRLALRHDSWWVDGDRDGGGLRLHAATRRDRLDLRLRPLVPPARLGRGGYLYVPPHSSHYYYSVPRMTSAGTLEVDGERRPVTGLAWLKHEWGFLYSDQVAGFVWFGVQLSSGQELEIGLIYDRMWNLARGSFAVVEEADGAVTPIRLDALGVTQSGDTWRSRRTGTVYPIGWALEVPGRGRLELRAVVPGQEMVVFPANLWAGTLAVTGDFDGAAVTGDCFTEVVGLDEPFGRGLFRSGKP